MMSFGNFRLYLHYRYAEKMQYLDDFLPIRKEDEQESQITKRCKNIKENISHDWLVDYIR